jgi:uncharacterized membrane protein YebE (DUF533 family)
MSGCATMKESLITGATIGASGGALIGNSRGTGAERHRNTNKGLLIGALIGTGISYLAFKDKKKKKHRKTSKNKIPINNVPQLTRPKVKRVWVEDKIQGKRFIKGHWEYIILEQSNWSQ